MNNHISNQMGDARGDFIKRIFVAILGIPIMVGAALAGGIWFFLLVTVMGTGALIEFYILAEKRESYPLRWFGVAAMLVLLVVFGYETITGLGVLPPTILPGDILLASIVLFVFVSLSFELFVRKGSPFVNLGATALGYLYVGLGAGTFLGIREFFNDGWIILLILFSIWICDTAAYFGGKSFGKRKLYTVVSPNKTVAGAVFGFVFAVAASIICKYLFVEYIDYTDAAVIGVIVGSVGQIGDLAESMFKRDAGVKDSSAFFPGHGGFLDRFDSIMFVSPAVFLYFLLVVF